MTGYRKGILSGDCAFRRLRGMTVLVMSAHCDDAALGCAGTLLKIRDQIGSDCEMIAITFSGADDGQRAQEERDAMLRFGVDATCIRDLPDSRLPDHWFDIKAQMLTLRDEIGSERIGLVLCPRLEDRHQDHRVVAENVWRVFRQHPIFEYEIAKYEGDLGHPNVYVSLDAGEAQRKVAILLESYPSRSCHRWWSGESFYALMRLRGIEANCTFAEGLYVRKMVL